MKLSKLKLGSLTLFSPPTDDQLAHAHAEKELAKTKRKLANQSKVLLLGSGDSGKSTILKQMRVINAVPFSATEVESFRQLVFTNLVNGVRLVVDIMQSLDIPLSQSAYQTYLLVERAPDVRQGEPFLPRYQQLFEQFWADEQIQKGVKKGNYLALPDNLNYFFSDLPRLFHPTYQPNLQDIIFCRARTTGITETVFKARPGVTNEIHMIDVGGQKSERRKWIHCFQGVTAILFLVSLSGYDQCLAEDREANQMQDSMTIWDGIVNNQFFVKTSMILFLNKEDLFAEKVLRSNIVDTFPDFDGPKRDVEAGKTYFRRRFMRLAAKAPRMKGREVYPYFTNATNTPLVKLVLAAVSDIILRGNLSESQLI